MANPLASLRHAWNLFSHDEKPANRNYPSGSSSYHSPSRVRFSRGNERTIVTSVYNRLAIDAASIRISHVRLDENDRLKEYIPSSLQNCLTVESNIDQTARGFFQDVVSSMLDEGCVAIVPVETTSNPHNSNSYDILSLRVGRITQWYPTSVEVELYNDTTGLKQWVTLPKNQIGIVENPLYAVINEPNSTMQRLITKLALMDSADAEVNSGNLDLLIQLPYVVKTDAKRAQAEERRREIEEQLNGAKYGVAYIDGTEKVTQLNRPIENNLMKQVEYLTNLLYSQLGLTQGVLDGTADDKTMNNYFNRTIEPIVGAITDEMHRKFLTRTARSQGQAIKYFRDPFKLIPVTEIAEIADKFTRNEIMSSNEIRQTVGMKPADDPKADELRNKNLSQSSEEVEEPTKPVNKEEDTANE